jgi:hypothetical protein
MSSYSKLDRRSAIDSFALSAARGQPPLDRSRPRCAITVKHLELFLAHSRDAQNGVAQQFDVLICRDAAGLTSLTEQKKYVPAGLAFEPANGDLIDAPAANAGQLYVTLARPICRRRGRS